MSGWERGWGSSGKLSVEARVSEWVGEGVGLFREAECGGKGWRGGGALQGG